MNVSEYLVASSLANSAVLKKISIFGTLFASKQLGFTMQAQTQTNWCWAATATSVSHFYWLFSTWTQCRVAGAELGRTDCCNSPVPGPCNVPWFLDRALTRTGNFVSILGGQASFAAVRAEIDAGRPVGARIGWNGGGGHFMVIYGYSQVLGTDYFDIDDPIYGKSHLTVADFASNYQGSGTWTHTYFTRRAFRLPFHDLVLSEVTLEHIRQLRPLLALKDEAGFDRSAAERGAERLGAVQRIYALGLDALTAPRRRAAPEPVALRVYELSGERPSAFFDVAEGETPRVLQMSSAPQHLEAYSQALSQALSVVDDKKTAELKMLRVPALNFEALWVSYEAADEDMLIPMRPAPGLVPGEAVPFARAMDALREAARPLADMDDQMGA